MGQGLLTVPGPPRVEPTRGTLEGGSKVTPLTPAPVTTRPGSRATQGRLPEETLNACEGVALGRPGVVRPRPRSDGPRPLRRQRPPPPLILRRRRRPHVAGRQDGGPPPRPTAPGLRGLAFGRRSSPLGLHLGSPDGDTTPRPMDPHGGSDHLGSSSRVKHV